MIFLFQTLLESAGHLLIIFDDQQVHSNLPEGSGKGFSDEDLKVTLSMLPQFAVVRQFEFISHS
jgi:hypothetical protein